MIEIYDYISIRLKESVVAKRLFLKINNKISHLRKNPYIYSKAGKTDKLKRKYRKIVIGNYIVLYTTDSENKKVYISHIIYGRRNYLY